MGVGKTAELADTESAYCQESFALQGEDRLIVLGVAGGLSPMRCAGSGGRRELRSADDAGIPQHGDSRIVIAQPRQHGMGVFATRGSTTPHL